MACGKTVPGTVHIPELISKNFTATSPRIILSSANFTTAGPLFDITDAQGEHEELMAIYVGRGLDPALAHQVAEQLMAHDALGAHARDELGITETLSARPLQAALASACSFAGGAALPLLVPPSSRRRSLIPVVSGASLACLALLGGVAARVGGARVTVGALRVTFWGALAMGLTAGVGALFGTGRERNGVLRYGSIGLLGFKFITPLLQSSTTLERLFTSARSAIFFTICPILDRNRGRVSIG